MPANIKGKKKKYGKSGMVSYKKGGTLKPVYNANGVRVPGMFQDGTELTGGMIEQNEEEVIKNLEHRRRKIKKKKKEKGNPFN